jgi:hypothetical protein
VERLNPLLRNNLKNMNDLGYVYKPVRSAAILTDTYVAGTVLAFDGVSSASNPVGYNQLVVCVDFTIGSLTTAEIKVEFSDDGTTYFQEVGSSIAAGVSTDTLLYHKIGATGQYYIPVSMAGRYVKISAKGTGTVTNSTMTITAILANR